MGDGLSGLAVTGCGDLRRRSATLRHEACLTRARRAGTAHLVAVIGQIGVLGIHLGIVGEIRRLGRGAPACWLTTHRLHRRQASTRAAQRD
eukprot:6289921-Prymnesium_polylepis.2